MRLMELANAILKEGHYSRAAASCLAWRIMNSYPPLLREEAIRMAKGEEPTEKIGGFDVGEVRAMAQIGAFEALELLAVMAEDQTAGDQLLMRLCRHDGRER